MTIKKTNYFTMDENKEPVEEENFIKWVSWFELADRSIIRSYYNDKIISTIFLGLNINLSENVEPLLYETMIFTKGCGYKEDLQYRYSTKKKAIIGHLEILNKLSNGEELE